MEWANKQGFFNAKVPFKQMLVEGIGHIKVYGLTCSEKDEYENAVVQIKGKKREVHLSNARAIMLIKTVRDGQGRALFTEADMGKIAEIPAAVVDPILDVARGLSGMSSDEMDELVKNSPPAPGPVPSGSSTG